MIHRCKPRKLVRNAAKAKRGRNLLRADPTKTQTLRRAFESHLVRQFKLLKGALVKLVAGEDAFGLTGKGELVPATNASENYQPFVCNGRLGWFPTENLGALIEVPDVRQRHHWDCGAACAMSVGLHFGVGPATLDEWIALLNTDVEESTRPEAISSYFGSLGLRVEARGGLTLQDLADFTARGWPVICPVQDYGSRREAGASFAYGHYLVVIGVGAGYVFCQDPSEDNVIAGGDFKSLQREGSVQKPGRVMIAQEDWLKVWHDRDADGRKYVRYGIAVEGAPVANCNPGQIRGADGRCGPGIGVGIDREEMPQIKGEDLDEFISYARSKGVGVTRKTESANELSPTQGEFRQERVDAIPDEQLTKPILVSSDKYVLDGTHRWVKHWQGSKTAAVPTLEIDLPLHEALALMREFPKAKFAANTRFAFHTDPRKITAFQAWLKAQLAATLRNQTEEELWRRYIEAGFRKGAGRSFDDVRAKARAADDPLDQRKLDFWRGSREEFLRGAFAQPETVEKVRLLAGRAYDDLEGVTEAMSTQMSRTLTDGLVEGKHPNEIAKDLVNDVDGVGIVRARTIARTEIIRAHAEGQLDALERMGVEEVGVAVEYATADDDQVCPQCAPLEGVVLKIEEAHGIIPAHPNCRCAFLPANVGEDDKDQKDTKREIDAAFSESAEAGGDWDDVSISKDRPESQVGNTAWSADDEEYFWHREQQEDAADNALREFSKFLKEG